MAPLVNGMIQGHLDAPVAPAWDDGCAAVGQQMVAGRLGIIPFIGDQHIHVHAFHQSGSMADVGVLSGREEQAYLPAHSIAQPMDLGVRTTARASYGPLFAVGTPMYPARRAVDLPLRDGALWHGRFEDRGEHPLVRPPEEPPMGGFERRMERAQRSPSRAAVEHMPHDAEKPAHIGFVVFHHRAYIFTTFERCLDG